MKFRTLAVLLAVLLGVALGGKPLLEKITGPDNQSGFTALAVENPSAVAAGVSPMQPVVVTLTNHEKTSRTYNWSLNSDTTRLDAGTETVRPGQTVAVSVSAPSAAIGDWVTFNVEGLPQELRWKLAAR